MPEIVDPESFRAALAELRKEEKEATRLHDSLSTKRRALPATRVENAADTFFTASDGSKVSLVDLFEERRQLIIYQFMLYDTEGEPCHGCSFAMDHIAHLGHLHSRDTTFAATAPASIEKINSYRERMGWSFPFYSSKGTFEEAGGDATWKDFSPTVLLKKDDGEVLHTYGTSHRGVEGLLSTYALLDMTPLGRQESGNGVIEFKLHDQY